MSRIKQKLSTHTHTAGRVTETDSERERERERQHDSCMTVIYAVYEALITLKSPKTKVLLKLQTHLS